MNDFKYWLFLCLAIVVLLGSCSPQARLNRLYDKHPELFDSDTTTINSVEVRERIDTMFLSGIEVDSVFLRDTLSVLDTLKILKDGVSTTVYITRTDTTILYDVKTRIDSFPIEVVLHDTVFREKQIVETTNVPESTKWYHIIGSFWLLIIILILCALIYRMLRFFYQLLTVFFKK